MDSVELVLAIEDKFNIHISDAEASNAETGSAGTLFDEFLVLSDTPRFGGCIARESTGSAAIYSAGIAFPTTERRRLWRSLQGKTELPIPNLRHPVWIETSLLVTGVLVALVPICFTTLGGNTLWMVLGLSIPGLYAGTLMVWMATPFARGFPRGVNTVGDLAKIVLAQNYSRPVAELGGQNRKDIWDKLCLVIVKQTGVNASEVFPEARIVDDLRID